jgi:ubiquinone/menaquinone biosynthesis C-methylase UbiE
MSLIKRISKKIRFDIATRFPGRFATWYSTLDNPVEVPVQREAYLLAKREYIKHGDHVLDVGFGLGYGLKILSGAGVILKGIDIDVRAVRQGPKLIKNIPGLADVSRYDGVTIPYPDRSFDCVTCIDVIEHVPDYIRLSREMLRVSRRVVFISTPNRRPEFTRPDGKPNNRWHIREWSFSEFSQIVDKFDNVDIHWHFINGSYEGPFNLSAKPTDETMALAPALMIR